MRTAFVLGLLFSHLVISLLDPDLGHYAAFIFVNLIALMNYKQVLRSEGPFIKLWLLICSFNIVALSLIQSGSFVGALLFFDYFILTIILLSLLNQYNGKSARDLTMSRGTLIYLLSVVAASLVASNYAGDRFSGFYENVLNFTGFIAAMFSLAFLALTPLYFFLFAIMLTFFAIVAKSKALSLVLITSMGIYVYRRSRRWAVIISALIFGLLVSFANFIDTDLIIETYALEPGPIWDRLSRYARIKEIGLGINEFANPTLCSRFYSVVCLTSESFLIGTVLGYGLLAGSVLCALFMRLLRGLNLLPFVCFALFSAGLFTPSILFVSYCLLTIFLITEGYDGDNNIDSTESQASGQVKHTKVVSKPFSI